MRLSSPFFFVKLRRFIQFECGCFICSIGYYAGIVVIIVLIMGSFVWTNDVNHLESREQKLSISFKNAGNKSLAADCQNRKYEVLGQTLRISFNRANLKIALYVDQISSLMKWCNMWYAIPIFRQHFCIFLPLVLYPRLLHHLYDLFSTKFFWSVLVPDIGARQTMEPKSMSNVVLRWCLVCLNTRCN